MNPAGERWLKIHTSLWFVPIALLLASIALALVLVGAQEGLSLDLARTWPRLFGSSAEGARSMLSAIATSMITVGGVVFSITIVALAQASSQYSPRVLRNFMQDRTTQAVLGLLVGAFAYCLVVLRSVRGGNGSEQDLPHLAILGGVVLALVAVAMLVYFIHHVASWIQAPTILSRIAADTAAAIDHLFPQTLGEPVHEPHRRAPLPAQWQPVASPETGYLVAVDDAGLLEFARRSGRVVRLAAAVGDFVVCGRPLVWLGGAAPVGEDDAQAMKTLIALGTERTIEQDAPYGMQQLVDVAVKALSPGINDPTTAVNCVDHLCALLVRLGGRHIPHPMRGDGDRVLVVARGPDFKDMTELAFAAIVHHARGDVEVLTRVLGALEVLEAAVAPAPRREALQDRAAELLEAVERDVASTLRRQPLLARLRALQQRLSAPAGVSEPMEPAARRR